MKKRNYYSIHKNKKKRKSTSTSQIEALRIALRVIRHAIILSQKLIQLSQSIKQIIPKYKISGNTEPIIVGIDSGYGKDNYIESVINRNGQIHILKHNEKLYENIYKMNIVIPDNYKINPFIDKDISEHIKNYYPNKNP